MTQNGFENNVWREIIKGSAAEDLYGKEAKSHLNLTAYNAINRALDIKVGYGIHSVAKQKKFCS